MLCQSAEHGLVVENDSHEADRVISVGILGRGGTMGDDFCSVVVCCCNSFCVDGDVLTMGRLFVQ